MQPSLAAARSRAHHSSCKQIETVESMWVFAAPMTALASTGGAMEDGADGEPVHTERLVAKRGATAKLAALQNRM
jgi:hypothetical protein